ncbi:MAG: GNAT family N-acetyltransferase [Armatimonadetes bacterium]|nr:GNAT family N-acetyltransferase [Armatimonadota bacterium]
MPFTSREATPADVPALARLHVETFIETHGGGENPPTVEMRERQWREILGKEDESDFCFVIEGPDGELVGFARGVAGDPDDPSEYTGVLNKIYLLRAYHRRGLGRRLLGHVARRFLSLGIRSMRLFGDAENPSNGFYERLGAERTYSDAGEFHGGYGWRDLQRLAALCPDE